MTYDQTTPFGTGLPTTARKKDEVLVRKNGNPTYFAADIAYHRNKFAAGL